MASANSGKIYRYCQEKAAFLSHRRSNGQSEAAAAGRAADTKGPSDNLNGKAVTRHLAQRDEESLAHPFSGTLFRHEKEPSAPHTQGNEVLYRHKLQPG